MHTTIEMNAENLNGLTAMDIVLQTRNDVKEMGIAELLRHKGAKQASQQQHINNAGDPQSQPSKNKKKNKRKKPIGNNRKEHWVQKMRDALMVAASLLATMAFQAVVSPPGGLFQSSDTVISESEVQNDLSSFFSFIGNSESSSSSNYNDFAPAPAVAQDTKTINCTIGKSVMSYYKPPVYNMFLVANTTSFLASLSIILLLISGLPLSRKFFMYIMMIVMWVAITGMGVSYFFCIYMITPQRKNMNVGLYLYIIGGCLLVGHAGVLVLGHVIQMTVKMIKWVYRALKALKRKPSLTMNSSSMGKDDSAHGIDI
nr:ankyrin repeat-containing protein BDA1-like [Ipomoea batatas]